MACPCNDILLPFYFHFSLSLLHADKTVLVIGSGPSGIDLVMAISQTAKKVLFSHHTHDGNHRFAPNVIKKGRIKEFTATGVRFADDDTAEEMITDVLYCTGQAMEKYIYI